MALGTREMLLVIRARDEASRVLGRLSTTLKNVDKDALAAAQAQMARGGALVSLGAGITAMGGAAVAWLESTTDAAADYDNAARLALTQTDNVGASLEQLKDIGRDVARSIPIAFEDTQKALYDIFSTVDVNVPQARKLLQEFSKAAVAGQTDVQTATQGTLQVMNGFHLGVEDVNRANDIMFRLVQKGVGTYEQFNTALGKAAPSANRAGQSLETLGGMMAFLTRNGLSTSMAATSASRAFDLISNSKVDKRLQDYGVAVRDASGNFRPLGDIVTDLGTKMQNLTAPERAKALEELFKGSGNNVQARRFFDLAVTGFDQLNSLTKSVSNSSGSMEAAYKIMFDSPRSKMQLMTNQYEAMRTEIGDKLLPVKLKLMEVVSKLLGWWNDLSPGMQKIIIIGAALAAGLAVLVGIVTMVAGAILIVNGALVLMGTTLGAVLAPAAAVIAIIIAIGAAVYFAIKYWDQIKTFIGMVWDWIVDKLKWAWDWIVKIFNDVKDFVVGVWDAIWGFIGPIISNIVDWIVKRWNDVVDFFHGLWERVVGPIQKGWDDLSATFQKGVDFVVGKLQEFWSWIQSIIQKIQPELDAAGHTFQVVWGAIMDIVGIVVDFLVSSWGRFIDNMESLWAHVQPIMDALLKVWLAVWPFLAGILQGAWIAIQTVLSAAVDILIGVWNAIVDVLSNIWTAFTNIFGGILDFLKGIIGFFVDLFTGNWGDLWKDFVNILKGAWEIIKGVLNLLAAPFIALWDILGGVAHAIGDAFMGLVNIFLTVFEAMWNFGGKVLSFLGSLIGNVLGWIGNLIGNVLGALGDFGMMLLNIGASLFQGLLDGIASVASGIFDWIGQFFLNIWNWILDFFGISSPSKTFFDLAGQLLMGMLNGLISFGEFIWNWFIGLPKQILGFVAGIARWLWDAGINLLKGMWNGIVNGATLIWNWFIGLPGQIWDAIKSIGSWLLDAGGNLVQGFIDGIQSMVSSLWNTVKNFFLDLLPGWVKDMLGISSPSKVFAELGKFTMQGFAVGIDSGAAMAINSATMAANAITNAFQPDFGTPGLSGYAAGYTGGTFAGAVAAGEQVGSTSTGQVVIPIQINTQEINPLQHAAELGEALANRVG